MLGLTVFFGFVTAGPWLPNSEAPVWAAGLFLPAAVLCGGSTLIVLVAAVRRVPLDDAATFARLRRVRHDRARVPDALQPSQRFLTAVGFLAGAAVILGDGLHPYDLLAKLLSFDLFWVVVFGGSYLVLGLFMALPYGPRRVLMRTASFLFGKERRRG